MHFHYLVPVWGKSYTELFSDVCLPMLMTPGNLGSANGRVEDQFVIMTTWEDHLAIRSSSYYERLCQLIRVEFLLIDGLIDISSSHAAMSECYALAMKRREVVPASTFFVFLTPDSFWPDGTFHRLAELAASGNRVVMACGLRLESEPVSEILKERIVLHTENVAIPMHELVGLAFKHLHQLSRAHNMLSKNGFLNAWPSHMYWINERDRQLIAHCFHLHPLMVRAPKAEIAIGTTIDGDFLDNLHYSLNHYCVLQDEFVGFELSPAERNWGQPLGSPSLLQISLFSLLYANSRHWHFFGKRIVLNGNPGRQIDPFLEQLVNRIVSKIQRKKALAMFIQKLRLNHVVHRLRRVKNQRIKNLMRRLFI